MKKLRIISYGLIAGLMLGYAVPAVQAGPENVKTEQKSRIKKIVSSKWFKIGAGIAAAAVALSGGYWFVRLRSKNTHLERKSDVRSQSCKCVCGSEEGVCIFSKFDLDKLDLGLDKDVTHFIELDSPSYNDSSDNHHTKGQHKVSWSLKVGGAEEHTIHISAYYSDEEQARNFLSNIESKVAAMGVSGTVITSEITDARCKNPTGEKSLKELERDLKKISSTMNGQQTSQAAVSAAFGGGGDAFSEFLRRNEQYENAKASSIGYHCDGGQRGNTLQQGTIWVWQDGDNEFFFKQLQDAPSSLKRMMKRINGCDVEEWRQVTVYNDIEEANAKGYCYSHPLFKQGKRDPHILGECCYWKKEELNSSF